MPESDSPRDGRPDDLPGDAVSTPTTSEVEVAPGRVLAVVDWISYLHLALGVVALLAIWALSESAASSLTKVAIAIVLSFALDTPVRLAQRRGLPRGAAAGLVCGVVLAALVALVVFLGPPAVEEAARFGEELPATIEEFHSFPLVGGWVEDAELSQQADEWLEDLPGSVTSETVSNWVGRAIDAATDVVQVIVLVLALLIDGERLVRRARRLVPAHLRPGADRAGRLVYQTLGRYFAGSLFLAMLSGTWVLTVGLILGVPLIVLAALWVAITDLVPQVGGFLGGSVFVALALTQGAVTGAIAGVLFVVYMSAENYLIQPAVVGKAVDLSPPTTMLAALIGGAAGGVPGALVATPFVGSVKVLYLAYRDEPDDGDEPTTPDPGEEELAEQSSSQA